MVTNLIAGTAMLAYFRARHTGLGTRERMQWALEHHGHQRHER